MMDTDDKLNELIRKKRETKTEPNRYLKLGLEFNPFPRAGISDINSNVIITERLKPLDEDVEQAVLHYISDSLFPNNPNSEDKYLSAVIRGDYGYGKTQTLLYIKFMLESFPEKLKYPKKPYVIYIDNPGAKLMELIGAIIHEIGEENFKKYLWNTFIDFINKSQNIKDELNSYLPHGYSLFGSDKYNPFSIENTINYKKFIDGYYQYFQRDVKKKKQFQDLLKVHVISFFTKKYNNSTVAGYFFDLLSDNIGLNKTWEILTTGGAKDLDKKEVYIIRAIFDLLKEQGFTDFYILVDEFEAVTFGRLSSSEIDRYFANLRALIDKERNWCSVFAMTVPAFGQLRQFSPPLADRISGKIIDLKPLDFIRAKVLVLQYLNLARNQSDSTFPFDDTALEELVKVTNGNHRIFLKTCFLLIQRAIDELKDKVPISSEFVAKHFQIEEE
jgi:hypothetical protein